SEVRVDLRTLQSDQRRRDNAVQRALGTSQYPYAVFQTEPVTGLALEDGVEETFELPGTMEIHGQKRPVTFQVRSVREGDTLRWVAEAQILMTDFGVEPPSIVGLISVEA